MNSLSKLAEMRANTPRMTLLHFMVAEAERENARVLEFVDELYPRLQRSHRYGTWQLTEGHYHESDH